MPTPRQERSRSPPRYPPSASYTTSSLPVHETRDREYGQRLPLNEPRFSQCPPRQRGSSSPFGIWADQSQASRNRHRGPTPSSEEYSRPRYSSHPFDRQRRGSSRNSRSTQRWPMPPSGEQYRVGQTSQPETPWEGSDMSHRSQENKRGRRDRVCDGSYSNSD